MKTKHLFLTALLLLSVGVFAQQIRRPTNPRQPGINREVPVQMTRLNSIYAGKPEREIKCFDNFDYDNSGNSKVNAYLLSMIMHFMYPSALAPSGFDEDAPDVRRLHNSANFEVAFRERVQHFFPENTEFKFINRNPQNGLDPEAMVISTDNYIIVAFRGTDRVYSNNQWIYDYAEFPVSNFSFALINTPEFSGKIHQGYYTSLFLIATELENYLRLKGGENKKLWITGHSLGSGQAQLFTTHLERNSDLKPFCTYAFAAPHVGDVTYVNDVNNRFRASTKLQRFDFMDDPVTKVPFEFLGYRKAGVRNKYTKEQGSANYFFNTAEDRTDNINPFFCMHHTHWYSRAAFFELQDGNPQLAAKCPLPPEKPDFVCNETDYQLVNGNGVIPNFFGISEDIEPGEYFIVNAQSGKYLDASGSNAHINGTPIQIWDIGESKTNNIWKLERVPSVVGGYTIQAKFKGKFIDADDWNVSNTNCKVQLWDRKPAIAGDRRNQEWSISRNSDGTYFIANVKDNTMFLHLPSSGARTNGTKVVLNKKQNSGRYQKWYIVKVS